MSLADALTLRAIQALADARTFARGKAYFHDGAVGLLDADEHEVRANVQGTQRYRVRLAVGADGELDYECDCPVGDDEVFCKHAVAVALSWLENVGEEVFEPGAKESAKPLKKRKTNHEQLREYLQTLSEDALRDWLLEAADRDRGIRDKLLFSAKAKAGTGASSLKSLVRQATRISGYVDWREAGGYADRLADLAQMLDERITDGDPKLIEVIEQAIAQAEPALGQIDDSNGSVMPAIMQLREVHERACNVLNPDPMALAERLFRFQTMRRLGHFPQCDSSLPARPGAARPHALCGSSSRRRGSGFPRWVPKLSAPTLTPLAFASSTRWKSLPKRPATSTHSSRRSRTISRTRTRSSNSRKFSNIMAATTRRSRGRKEGSRRFRAERLDDLVQFCIDEHLRRDNADQVESLAWQRFVRQPGSDAYFELAKVAKRIERAGELGARALQHLWQLVRAEEAPNAEAASKLAAADSKRAGRHSPSPEGIGPGVGSVLRRHRRYALVGQSGGGPRQDSSGGSDEPLQEASSPRGERRNARSAVWGSIRARQGDSGVTRCAEAGRALQARTRRTATDVEGQAELHQAARYCWDDLSLDETAANQ